MQHTDDGGCLGFIPDFAFIPAILSVFMMIVFSCLSCPMAKKKAYKLKKNNIIVDGQLLWETRVLWPLYRQLNNSYNTLLGAKDLCSLKF